jgi:hypothetical protein
MAMGTSVPPRAYTRETLTTAFNWLQSQPESVRSKATTPDALVGLYMQAQRGGAYATGFDAEAPQSSQAFMSDLKNLAEGLREFDDSRQPRAVNPPASSRAQLGQHQTYPQNQFAVSDAVSTPVSVSVSAPVSPVSAPAAAPRPAQAPAAAAATAAEVPPSVAASFAATSAVTASTLAGELNERSLQMLREVQLALNLTSEHETMNMMIALAHKSLKSLLA